MRLRLTVIFLLAGLSAFGQKFDFGVFGGGSFYMSKDIGNSRESVSAGFKNGFAAGVSLGNDMYSHLGGEVRYVYLKNDSKLSGRSSGADFGGESHAVHYDLLFYGSRTGSKVRPYVAAGGGMKLFRGTGEEQAFQPLSDIAILTKTREIKPMLSVGAGIKAGIGKRSFLRIDVHDYLTTFPKEVITPATGSTAGGWMQNFVVTAGIGLNF